MKRYVVTGAGGFLGRALTKKLLDHGHQVVGLARGQYPELQGWGVATKRVDLGKPEIDLVEVLAGCEAVFHVAAKVEMWGPYAEFYSANVVATNNLLRAAKLAGVRKFIFTSSPSVIADGSNLKGVDESYPFPKHYKAFYPQTKALAENAVLQANSPDFFTVALRPHLIFGPGDQSLVPMILSKAAAGRLVQVGTGKNLSDFCFIDDCVQAHLLAEQALNSKPLSRGRAFFISQGQPVELWLWIRKVLEYHGLSLGQRALPFKIANVLAGLCEVACKFFPQIGEPLLTRFLISEMVTDHYFDIAAAKNIIGFQPKYSVWQALELTYGANNSASINY